MRNWKCRLPALLLAAAMLVIPAYAEETVLIEDEPPEEYLELYPAGGQEAAVVESAGPQDSPLRGKSILFFGDSLTTGYRLSDRNQSWPSLLGSSYGMDVYNISISGSTFSKAQQYGYMPGGCYEPYVDRALPDGDFDIVFIEGGGNDWYCGIPIGSGTETRDPYTFRGAVNVVIDRVQEKYPNALILCMTGWKAQRQPSDSDYIPGGDYYDALTELCSIRGVPCFQARDSQVSGIYPEDSEFRAKYFLTPTDHWHLNAAGQALFLPTIAGWLEEQIRVCGFEDVIRGSWYAEAVRYAYENGLMVGVGNNQFAPNMDMSRAMLVTVLYRAAGSPDVSGLERPFVDVPAGTYYTNAVTWAYHIGLTYGVDSTHFAPGNSLTREQMATFFYRLAAPAEQRGQEDMAVLDSFSDADEIHGFAQQPMAWAVKNGILAGVGGGRMAPRETATRAQLAAVLRRILNQFDLF